MTDQNETIDKPQIFRPLLGWQIVGYFISGIIFCIYANHIINTVSNIFIPIQQHNDLIFFMDIIGFIIVSLFIYNTFLSISSKLILTSDELIYTTIFSSIKIELNDVMSVQFKKPTLSKSVTHLIVIPNPELQKEDIIVDVRCFSVDDYNRICDILQKRWLFNSLIVSASQKTTDITPDNFTDKTIIIYPSFGWVLYSIFITVFMLLVLIEGGFYTVFISALLSNGLNVRIIPFILAPLLLIFCFFILVWSNSIKFIISSNEIIYSTMLSSKAIDYNDIDSVIEYKSLNRNWPWDLKVTQLIIKFKTELNRKEIVAYVRVIDGNDYKKIHDILQEKNLIKVTVVGIKYF